MIQYKTNYPLGLVAKTKRVIVPGSMYEGLFPGIDNTNPILNRDGNVSDTVEMCKEIVLKTLNDTKKVAPLLQRPSLGETCNAVFDFFYKHYQYKEDDKGVEQLRRPARGWHDRKSGIDCDCFSISISSILTNLSIPHCFRIVKMYGRSYYQHIYVVVPKFKGANMNKRSDYIVIDPVLDKHDYEAPGINEKKDYPMGIPIQYLNGVGGYPSAMPVNQFAGELASLGSVFQETSKPLSGEAAFRGFLNKSKKHLILTRNMIAKKPHMVAKYYRPQILLGMIDQAIGAWDNDHARENALEQLGGIEHTALQNQQLQGLGAIDGFFSKLKTGVKKVGEGIKKGAKAVAKVAKKVVKAVVKFNPLTIAARAGFRLAMKTNFLKIAEKAYWGCFSEAEAKAKGVSSAYWQKSKKVKDKIEDIFTRLLQGKGENIVEDIQKGGKKKAGGGNLKGTDGLGVVTTASVTAAMSFLTPIIAFVKKLFGNKGGGGGEGGEAATGEGGESEFSDSEGGEPMSDDPGDSGSGDEGDSGSSEGGGGGGLFDSGGSGGGGLNLKNNKLLLYGGLALGAMLLMKSGSSAPATPYYPPPSYPPPYPGMRGVNGVKKKRKARPTTKATKTIKLT